MKSIVVLALLGLVDAQRFPIQEPSLKAKLRPPLLLADADTSGQAENIGKEADAGQESDTGADDT